MSGGGKKSICVIFRNVCQLSYDNHETAGRVYDLVVRLAYGDQVDRTPHLLNNLPDQDKNVVKVKSQPDGVDIYRVDHYHVVIYEENVQSRFKTLGEAEKAARTCVADLAKKRAKVLQERAKKRFNLVRTKAITRTRDADGVDVAFLPMKLTKDQSVKVLLDDSIWLDLVAASATLKPGFGCRATVKIDRKEPFLNRYLRPAVGNDIVDHVNGNPLDHRLANLEVRDRAANAQNRRTAIKDFIGVFPTKAGGWIVMIKLKVENRFASKTFSAEDFGKALELYDLAALTLHGPFARLNNPENLKEYLEDLEKQKTKSRIEEFLTKKVKSSTYDGVTVKDGVYIGSYTQWVDRVLVSSGSREFYGGTDGSDEVKAAIYADLWKLKVYEAKYRVNFEFMRPWYLFYMPELNRDSELEIIEKAYRRIGGDRFVLDSRTPITPPSASSSSASPPRASTLAVASTSSAPFDSSVHKRKRDE